MALASIVLIPLPRSLFACCFSAVVPGGQRLPITKKDHVRIRRLPRWCMNF